MDLSKSNQITGIVTSSYETTRRTAGRYATDVPIYAFTVDNYGKILGAFRPNKNYKFLLDNLRIGDRIKVYFKESNIDNININVYQIEKNGAVILDYETYGKNHRNLSYFIFPIGLLFLFISFKVLTQKIK
jgi:hypothetical protein